MEPILSAIAEIADSSSNIRDAVLTILGVLVTIGLAWNIVKGLQK